MYWITLSVHIFNGSDKSSTFLQQILCHFKIIFLISLYRWSLFFVNQMKSVHNSFHDKRAIVQKNVIQRENHFGDILWLDTFECQNKGPF